MRRFVLTVGLLSLVACSPDPHQAAFTGTWNFTEENSIASTSETVQVQVSARFPKFRITTLSKRLEKTDVYDGASIHEKSIYKVESYPAEVFDLQEPAEPPQPIVSSDAMTPEKAASQRFWAQALEGDSSPGGLVAGRDTVLYSAKWKRQDGEFSTQIWVDQKTRIMLKSVESIYSSQAQSLVRRSSKECTAIDFTPPADAVFSRP